MANQGIGSFRSGIQCQSSSKSIIGTQYQSFAVPLDTTGATPAFTNTRSVLFDGVDEICTIPGDNTLNPTLSLTITAWFKTTANSDIQTIFASWNGPANLRKYMFRLTAAGAVQFFISNSGTAGNIQFWDSATSGLNDGNWHNISVSWLQNTAAVLVIDGTQDTFTSAQSDRTLFSTTQPVLIAANNSTTPTQLFDGNLDEIALYGTDLSVAQMQTIYNSGVPLDLSTGPEAADLDAWWRMGDADTFPTLTDNSSNTNNATMVNMEAGDIVADSP